MFKKALFICALMVLVAGCGEKAENEKPKADNNFQQRLIKQQTSVRSGENKVELDKTGDVTLLANKQADGDMFTEITLQTKDKSKTFPWTSMSKYYPEDPSVNIADVDADGKEEVIVILLKATGTGICLEEIHVLNKEDLTEIMIEDPLDAIEKKVNSKITKSNGKVNVVIEWDDKKIEKSYKESEAGVWNEYVFWGGIMKYQLHNNKIYAIVPGSVATTWYVVVAIVEYGPDLKARTITVKDLDGTNYPDVFED